MRALIILLLLGNCSLAFADDPDPPIETSGEVEFWVYEGEITGTMRVPGVDLEVEVVLPPGYYFSQGAYNTLNTEMVRLQDAETRLQAENESLRKSASESGSWKSYAIVFGVGLAAGAAAVWAQ
jgi:hypothetical protein